MNRVEVEASRAAPSAGAAACLRGGGEMGALMRARDWSQTPLGTVEGWSPSLRMMTSVLLANRFPMLLWWGPDQISIYNDAYRPILATKHPRALGLPVRECWSEIWDVLRPLILTPLHGGPPTWSDDLALEIRRRGFLEETHFTVAYSPVPDDTAPNGIGGVLATVHEITAQVVGERRGAVLRDLGALAAVAKSAEEACASAARALSPHGKDLPFALVYLLEEDGRVARLAGAAGVAPGTACSPAVVDLQGDGEGWPLARVAREEEAVVVDDLAARFGDLPRGPWSDPPQRAMALPIRSNLAHRAAGVLVAGVSPRLELDAAYRTFLDLVTARLATAVASARAHEEERRRAQALAELDRAKTVFFSNVSHEFRTPLTLMLGHVEEGLQDADDALSAGHRQRQLTVHRNALRLLKLVNSLLDFSRIEAGRVEASYEPTDLGAFTGEIASAFRSLVERAGLRLVLDCPPLAEPALVDREMWEKIVLNLVSNAFKFTFEGEIAVRVERGPGEVRLVVADTGTGIVPEHLPHVFDRFYRVEGARGRTYEGTGIGLALVRELARLHGGSATVASEPGQGTTFTIAIPAGDAHLPRERIRAARTQPSTALGVRPFVDEAAGWIGAGGPLDGNGEPADAGRADAPTGARPGKGRGAHLLVADDNADMRAYLARLLRPLGTVETVGDGRQALAAVRRRLPDLVVSDVMMPEVDGLGLLRALREDERTRTLPIVLLSARAGEEERVQGASAGADDYVVKPFSARELVARVRAQLQLARARREHGEAVRQREERFRALVRASSDVVYRMSPDWGEMLVLHGRDFIPDTDQPSRSWLERYLPADERPRVTAAIGEAIRTRSVFELEHRVLRVDGTVGWTLSRAIPVVGADGEVVEWFGTASDVTQRRVAEEALRRANLELEDADRRKDRFLGVLSHELRNPLAPIRNGLAILERAAPGSEPALRARSIIHRQVEQLARLVDDLLDVTRISRGKVQLARERLDLSALVQRTVDDHRPVFAEAGVALQLRPGPGPVHVQGDRNRLAQIVGNLLQNAAKFTPRGGTATVSVVSAEAEGRAVLRVSDTGAGLAPELVERLFEPFVQADATLDRSRGGLGLGLALVKELVELHGGEVAAHSAGPGHGSEFVVRLPLAAAAERAPAADPEIAPAAGRRRVLIIEDNVDAADTLRDVLELAGHEVAVAYDGPQGVAAARRLRPEVVLCDIGLPGMDGFEVARALRADGALDGTVLVALSGYALPRDVERAAEAGFDHHVAKPPSLAALEAILDALPRSHVGSAPGSEPRQASSPAS
ncbi:MAG TPA: ATP-binding protein [Anaeromyxobacteraceae bacterium]|nr:ATP-binding protein [Anaeromyxobacteraceae bacterium]